MKTKVLFVCVHNSARSQMAEAFLNLIAGTEFEAESAGLEPGNLNPFVVKVMNEIGIDISGNRTNGVWDYFRKGRVYQYVITVCDVNTEEKCPIFPGVTKRLSWPFTDPASFTGTEEEKLSQTRLVRDSIKAEIENFIHTHQQVNF
ncbi:MAG: arsenate reductase ArsC [Bacteroidetes bacterium]|nr:arsenate reductase ArsC [Bacteroidota bacterium]